MFRKHGMCDVKFSLILLILFNVVSRERTNALMCYHCESWAYSGDTYCANPFLKKRSAIMGCTDPGSGYEAICVTYTTWWGWRTVVRTCDSRAIGTSRCKTGTECRECTSYLCNSDNYP